MRILLIPGHGDGDSGACGNGYREADLAREMVDSVSLKLKPYAKVDVFDKAKNMYKYLKSNSFDFSKYDYVFEVHLNAYNSNTRGCEILVHPTESATSVEKQILKNICNIGFTNRGVKTRSDLQNMNICKKSYGVSYALIEMCFIDNAEDMKLFTANKDRIAYAIANGMITGFGLGEALPEDRFTDISKCWGREHINQLAEMGIVSGRGNGLFDPKAPVTREEVAIMIRNAIRYITGK